MIPNHKGCYSMAWAGFEPRIWGPLSAALPSALSVFDRVFFFVCYLFSPSLLMHGCLGNILMEWGRLQPGLFRASHSVLRELHASCLLTLLFPYLGSLSFFNSQFTSFKSSLFFVFPLRASDRVLSERRPARLCGRSWAGVCIASNSFSFAFRS